ncbi:hypothetical protein MXB_373 [Myxobolus squamalis]|nr:hypothetical protein MXB_373 [Myxobolus squamalis]
MKPPVTYEQIAKILKISPLKRYGQNFLLNESVTRNNNIFYIIQDKMAKNAGVKNCHVVEVGAGPGSLTRSIILEGCDEIDCVEVDKRLIPLLEVYYIKLLLSLKSSTQTPMRINLKDIFKFDIGEALSSIQRVPWIDETVLPKARILGNLPFNISIGLLLQWLKAVSERRGPFQLGRIPMYLTFQKEVADNLTCKNMGDTSRLTMMTQAFCSSRQVQFIHRSHFVPIPKVILTKSSS